MHKFGNWLLVNLPALLQAGAAIVLVFVTRRYVQLTRHLASTGQKQLALATTPNVLLVPINDRAHIVNMSPGHIWVEKFRAGLSTGGALRHTRSRRFGLPTGEGMELIPNTALVLRLRTESPGGETTVEAAGLVVFLDFFHGPSGSKRFSVRYEYKPDSDEFVREGHP